MKVVTCNPGNMKVSVEVYNDCAFKIIDKWDPKLYAKTCDTMFYLRDGSGAYVWDCNEWIFLKFSGSAKSDWDAEENEAGGILNKPFETINEDDFEVVDGKLKSANTLKATNMDKSKVTLSDGNQSLTIKAEVVAVEDYKAGMSGIWVQGKLQDIRQKFVDVYGLTAPIRTGGVPLATPTYRMGSTNVGSGIAYTYVTSTNPVKVYIIEENGVYYVHTVLTDGQPIIYQTHSILYFATKPNPDVLPKTITVDWSKGQLMDPNMVTFLNNLNDRAASTSYGTLPATPAATDKKKIFVTPDDHVYVVNSAGTGFIQIG